MTSILKSSSFKQLNNLFFLFQTKFFGELNLKRDNQIPSIIGITVDWHTLPFNDSPGLRADDLVEVQLDDLAVQLSLKDLMI